MEKEFENLNACNQQFFVLKLENLSFTVSKLCFFVVVARAETHQISA